MLGAVLLNKMVWESVTEKVLSEQRRRRRSKPGGCGGRRKGVPGTGTCECQGPESPAQCKEQ